MAMGAALIAIGGSIGIWVHSHAQKEEDNPVAPGVPRVVRGVLIVPTAFQKNAGLAFDRVKSGTLVPVLKVVGTVTFDPEHVAAVGTRIAGLVRTLSKLEGDVVEKGDVLAEVQSTALAEAQSQVAVSDAKMEAAKRNALRERELLAQNLSTAREAELAEAALKQYSSELHAGRERVRVLGGGNGQPLGVYRLISPLKGTVVERSIHAGQAVDVNLIAYRVANLEHLWVELSVSSQELAGLHVGDKVTLRPLSDAPITIGGVVAHVGEIVNPRTGAADVRIEVKNTQRALRPGQSVSATIRASQASVQGLLIPRSAVTFVDGSPTVFVKMGSEQFQRRGVKLGAADSSKQVVLDGLEVHEQVVAKGVFALKSELFR